MQGPVASHAACNSSVKGGEVSVSAVRIVGVGVAVGSIAGLPVMLVGGLAVLIQKEIPFGQAQLGIAIAAYFATGALAAAPAGWVTERLGPRNAAWLGVTCTIASLVGIPLIAHSWASLVVLLAVGGIGSALAEVSTIVLIVRGVAADRQGLALGVKQTAFPIASLLAGLSLPAIGLTAGWRLAFILSAAIAPLTAAAMPASITRRPRYGRLNEANIPVGALALLAVGVAMAAAGGSSGAVFIVPSSVDRSLTPADAGVVLAAGSFVGLCVRVAVGWLTDRLGRGSLMLVAMLMVAGAVGYVGLAFSSQPALILFFAMLAFGGGWGWPGLWQVAMSRMNPVAPGAAIGVVLAGGMTGAVLGPIVFGALVENVAYSASWLWLSATALAGAGVVLLSRNRLLRSTPSGS